jgi:hypothetical protein
MEQHAIFASEEERQQDWFLSVKLLALPRLLLILFRAGDLARCRKSFFGDSA